MMLPRVSNPWTARSPGSRPRTPPPGPEKTVPPHGRRRRPSGQPREPQPRRQPHHAQRRAGQETPGNPAGRRIPNRDPSPTPRHPPAFRSFAWSPASKPPRWSWPFRLGSRAGPAPTVSKTATWSLRPPQKLGSSRRGVNSDSPALRAEFPETGSTTPKENSRKSNSTPFSHNSDWHSTRAPSRVPRCAGPGS